MLVRVTLVCVDELSDARWVGMGAVLYGLTVMRVNRGRSDITNIFRTGVSGVNSGANQREALTQHTCRDQDQTETNKHSINSYAY